MIKILKKNDAIYYNFEEKYLDEQGNEVWNIPKDVEEFKKLAIDTISWQIGNNVKKSLGDTQTLLSASNAKAIALLAKLLKPTQAQISTLTTLEKDSWVKLKALADNGYADSELLNASLTNVTTFIQKGSDKIARVVKAKTLEDVINILNEE